LGTLLFDLLTQSEELDRANVFDIELLAGRLVDVTRWLRQQPEGRQAAIGYFGASTGAGAALWAAASPDADVAAVVSRGGRPDLAGSRLRCENRLSVVPGASHLFEEADTLNVAAELACDWFVDYLTPVGHSLV
jgi:dienelactone hydrolase